MRGAASGSEYCATGGSSGSGLGAAAGGSGLGLGLAGFFAGAGAGSAVGSRTFSTDSSQVGTCSTVSSCGSSGGGDFLRPFFFPSPCFCAASVARNSSASGPSRIDARFRATAEHLLRQVAVHLGRLAGRVVLQNGLTLHRRLRVAHRLADLRVQNEAPEVLLQDFDRLPGVQEPPVEHRRENADDLDL